MLLSGLFRGRKPSNTPTRRRSEFRPHLEALEDRCLPSTLTVMNNLDSGPASLRADIAAAQSGDTIVFAKGVTGSIRLNSGVELYINKNLDIEGPGASQLAIEGAGSRVFEVAAGVQLTLSGLTIQGGNGIYGGSDIHVNDYKGGGILNWGTLMVKGCIVTGNFNQISSPSFDLGGGIYNAGTLTLSGTTVTRNYAGEGAGIYNASTGILTVLNSSVTRNYTIVNGSVLGECDLHNDGQFTVDSHSKIGVIC